MKIFLKIVLLMLLTGVNAAESVKVSDFKPSRENATKAVQAALDSGAKQVIFDNPGFEYLVTPIQLRSNQELIFEDGVQVRALPGAFKGRTDSLFTGKGVENVIIRGSGQAVLAMNKSDYQDSKRYRPGEWRNIVSLQSCRNITVRNLTMKSSGGDGVYVSTGRNFGKPEGCRDILLEDLILDDHHRQGISVISVENLMIRNCRISNTSGTAPQCGIDFEPNQPSEYLKNCVVENCDFINNARAGILVYNGGLLSPLDITVRNCRFSGAEGINIAADQAEKKPNRGRILLENCEFSELSRPIVIRNHRAGLNLNLVNCKIDNLSGKAPVPINIFTEHPEDCGGIDFGRLVILQDHKLKIMEFSGAKGAGLEVPGGEIIVTSKDGENKNFDLKKFAARHRPDPILKNFQTGQLPAFGWKPAANEGKGGHKFLIRGNTDFVQYADGVNPVELRFQETWKGKNAPKIAEQVEIFDPAGTPHDKFTIDREDFTYRFAPTNAGVYRFTISSKGHRAIKIESTAPGHGFGAARRLRMFRCSGTLYFQVPAGVENVSIELWGEPPTEGISADLLDAEGKIVAQAPHKASAQIMTAKRSNTEHAEIWSVRITRADEDWGIRLGAPLPPVLYTARENLLIPAK